MADIFIVLVWVCAAAGAWMLGYYYGVQNLRNRNKQVIKAIEENNQIYQNWSAEPEGASWERGYAAGIKATLDTLHGFLDKAT